MQSLFYKKVELIIIIIVFSDMVKAKKINIFPYFYAPGGYPLPKIPEFYLRQLKAIRFNEGLQGRELLFLKAELSEDDKDHCKRMTKHCENDSFESWYLQSKCQEKNTKALLCIPKTETGKFILKLLITEFDLFGYKIKGDRGRNNKSNIIIIRNDYIRLRVYPVLEAEGFNRKNAFAVIGKVFHLKYNTIFDIVYK